MGTENNAGNNKVSSSKSDKNENQAVATKSVVIGNRKNEINNNHRPEHQLFHTKKILSNEVNKTSYDNIENLLANAMKATTTSGGSKTDDVANKWFYESLNDEERIEFEKGITSIIHRGCMVAAKRSYDTVLLQKRANKLEASNKKRKRRCQHDQVNNYFHPLGHLPPLNYDYYHRGNNFPPNYPPPPPGFHHDNPNYNRRRFEEYHHDMERREREGTDFYDSRRYYHNAPSYNNKRYNDYDSHDDHYYHRSSFNHAREDDQLTIRSRSRSYESSWDRTTRGRHISNFSQTPESFSRLKLQRNIDGVSNAESQDKSRTEPTCGDVSPSVKFKDSSDIEEDCWRILEKEGISSSKKSRQGNRQHSRSSSDDKYQERSGSCDRYLRREQDRSVDSERRRRQESRKRRDEDDSRSRKKRRESYHRRKSPSYSDDERRRSNGKDDGVSSSSRRSNRDRSRRKSDKRRRDGYCDTMEKKRRQSSSSRRRSKHSDDERVIKKEKNTSFSNDDNHETFGKVAKKDSFLTLTK